MLRDDKFQNFERSGSLSYKSKSVQFECLDSSILNPNVSELARAVAIILQSQVQEDMIRYKRVKPRDPYFIFCEEKYIPRKKDLTLEQIAALYEIPAVEDIQDVLYNFYECGQFSPECLIVSLIYINRVIAIKKLPFLNTTWRPIILTALLTAQKVMDDQCLSNSDFAYIYPFFGIEELNKLEKCFLELIEYNLTVKLALYLRYYWDLRTLINQIQIEIPLHQEKEIESLLTKKLDNISKNFKEHFVEKEASTLDDKFFLNMKSIKSMDSI